MSAKIIADKSFTPANIASVSSSVDTLGYSRSKCRAAARSILRYNQRKAEQFALPSDKLHSSYLELHGQGCAKGVELEEIKTVLNDSFNDLLDAASMLDRIDGGITLVMRCPGYTSSTKISPENITVDAYISPRELAAGGKKATEHVALIVQAFGEHLALPHLHRFQTQCIVEGVQPLPAPAAGKPLMADGHSHLPPPLSKGGSHIRCRCRPAGTLAQDIAIHNLSLPGPPAPQLTKTTKKIPEIIISDDDDDDSMLDTQAGRKSRADGYHGALISIGPRTDAIFERFHLDDSLIPRIRVLINSHYSNKWEKLFRSDAWGLTYEEADKLTQALLADITADAQLSKSTEKSSRGYGLTSLVLTAILAALIAIYVF